MIGIDRYSIRQAALYGNPRHSAAENSAGAAAQQSSVQLSGGSESGQSSRSKLSAAFWSIQSAGKSGDDGADTPEAQFTKLGRMSLAERIRAQILEKHQLTEADFKKLSDSDRQAIEDEIREAILKAYGAEDGEGRAAKDAQLADASPVEGVPAAQKTEG